MVINYLGHFEGGENFGCNAGCKMVYVDAFGEVSPCVFLPFSFGNVRERPLADTLRDMRDHFPGEARCFINRNYRVLGQRRRRCACLWIAVERSRLLEKVKFGPPSEFNRRLLRKKGGGVTRTRSIKMAGVSLAGTFAVVGVIFVAIPAKVLAAFNRLADA